GLARAVRPDDADDAAGRQREIELLEQEPVAEGLADPLRLHDERAQARAGRDDNFEFPLLLRRALLQHRFVRIDARLALRLPRARPTAALPRRTGATARAGWKSRPATGARAPDRARECTARR